MGKSKYELVWLRLTWTVIEWVFLLFRVMDEGAYFYRACCLEHLQSRKVQYRGPLLTLFFKTLEKQPCEQKIHNGEMTLIKGSFQLWEFTPNPGN